MKGFTVRKMVFCALFAALIVVFAQIQVPLPGLVPISLATFGVMMAGLLLGWKLGLLAVAVYVLLGAVGVPVFAGFKGGIAALTGPTGGYIIGYLPYAVLAGLPVKKAQESFWGRLGESMGLCVLPFLPGDAVKMGLSSFLAPRLRKAIKD